MTSPADKARKRIEDAQNAAREVALEGNLRRDSRVVTLIAATGHLILTIESLLAEGEELPWAVTNVVNERSHFALFKHQEDAQIFADDGQTWMVIPNPLISEADND